MITTTEIVDEARTWIGTPFRHQGRLKRVGVDCVGLIVGVGVAVGFRIIDFRNYDENFPDTRRLHFEMHTQFTREDRMSPGCIVLLALQHESDPSHLAILTGDDSIIHCWNRRGVVEHELGAWRRRIRGIFTYGK